MRENILKVLRYLFLISFAGLLFNCSGHSDIKKSINFIVHLEKPIKGEKVYITGNNVSLGNWNPGAVELNRLSDSLWTKTVFLPQYENISFKITRGSWNSEATDEDGWLLTNKTLLVKDDTILNIVVTNWLDQMYARRIHESYFKGSDPGLNLINNWKYHSGDNFKWADKNINDSSWETISSNLSEGNLPKSGWNNIGWFRNHLIVDSSLWNKSFAILIGQLGASEVYLNGKLKFKIGNIGRERIDYFPAQNRTWQEIKLDACKNQVIAVRYANYASGYLNKINFDAGFNIYLTNLNTAFAQIPEYVRNSSVHEMIFTVIPLILFILHLILYSFYRKQKQNLFYALCLLGFAGLTYFQFERDVITYPGTIILYYIMNNVSIVVTIFFGMMTGMAIRFVKLPKSYLIFLAAGILLIIIGIISPVSKLTGILNYIYFGITTLGSFTPGSRNEKSTQKGTWIILNGFIILIFFVIYQILIDFSAVPALFNINQVFVYGMLALAISMSIFLAYNFAYINRSLEIQLNNVKLLSEKTIEQERLANKRELERKIVDFENERKSKELESARELQLSLLPKEVPKLEKLDISCYTKTATEVGGDYYDFFNGKDNKLTIAIGDATGHGLKAGNMVIVTKGLLNILSLNDDLTSILKASNEAIKKMNLNMLTMCLAVLRIEENKIKYSSAGMPPLLIYRQRTKQVEQFILKAMPLGAFYNFPYENIETDISSGDVILMMSDGLTELFNDKKELFGIENVTALLIDSGSKSSEEIINFIINKSIQWANSEQLSDDLTVIAVKIK